jgi:predicted transcriptional regulator
VNASVKDQARKLVEALADDATWDDLMYQIYVREAIEEGLRDADEGRVVNTATVRADFGLPR